MALITANGGQIEAEILGTDTNPAVLLIRGLGSQMTGWPDDLVDGLLVDRFRVVIFDNRDVGLSQKYGPCDRAGSDTPVYQIEDMAADAMGVLDAFGIDCAHVAGMSMGGMITQAILAGHSDRVLTATIIMSSSMHPDLPPRDAEASRLLTLQPETPGDVDEIIDIALQGERYWGSPAFSAPEADKAAHLRAKHARNYCPGGVARQWLAASHWAADADALSRVTCPVQVVHGLDDTLLPPSHGRDIARMIPTASLMEIPGMGHDLEGAVATMLRHAITGIAHQTHAP